MFVCACPLKLPFANNNHKTPSTITATDGKYDSEVKEAQEAHQHTLETSEKKKKSYKRGSFILFVCIFTLRVVGIYSCAPFASTFL